MRDKVINMNESLVSVIIPVYNSSEYLKQCLISIVEQTYRNLEIIIVDDGSTDGSSLMCDQFAEIDSRIKVLHMGNEGASLARKTGVDNSNGDYFLFVDSDDWIDLDTIEKCLNSVIEKKSDCVLFSYIKEYQNKSFEVSLFDYEFSYDIKDSEKYVHRKLIGLNSSELDRPHKIDNISSVCMKLYSKKCIENGKFISERIIGTSEDTIFNMYALENASITYIHEYLYHYRKSNVESITSCYKPDLSNQWDNMYRCFFQYVMNHEKKQEYESLLYNRIACGMIGLGLNEVNNSENVLTVSKKIKTILNKALYEEAFKRLDVSYCPFKWKIFFVFCKLKMSLSLTLMLKTMNYLRSKISV